MPMTYKNWVDRAALGDIRWIVVRDTTIGGEYFTPDHDWRPDIDHADVYATLDWARTVAERLGGYLLRIRKDSGGVTVI